jgi:hypothetical protein
MDHAYLHEPPHVHEGPGEQDREGRYLGRKAHLSFRGLPEVPDRQQKFICNNGNNEGPGTFQLRVPRGEAAPKSEIAGNGCPRKRDSRERTGSATKDVDWIIQRVCVRETEKRGFLLMPGNGV